MGPSPQRERARGLRAALLYAAACAAFLPSLRNGWIWDDDRHVVSNTALRSWTGLARLWGVLGTVPQYYPLTHTVFWLEHRLWGLHPLGYHLVNVLVHAANAVLVWLLLERLALPGAFFAALVFAVHPIQAESVLWVTELKNVLSGFFTLAAALAYLRWDENGRTREREYGAAAALFLAALLSKTTACFLPAALLLFAWYKRGKLEKRDVYPLLSLFAAGLALGLLTPWLERTGVGAHGAEWAFTPAQRVLIAGRALWFYIGKLAWPYPLVFVYPRWTLDTSSWVQWLWPAGAAAFLAALWFGRRRFGRGPMTAALGFAGALFPALGFFDLYPMRYTFVADHYAYMAVLFVIAPVAALAARAAAGLESGARRTAMVLGGLLLTVYVGVDWSRASVYENPETLWRDTLAHNPDSWMARYNLGTALAGEGNTEGAIAEMRSALTLVPESAEIHNTLGTLLAAQGERRAAEGEYRHALRLKPEFPEAHNDLGSLYEDTDREQQAEAEFSEALREDPKFAPARVDLGLSLERSGRFEQAELQFERVLESIPEYTQARLELGDIYLESGRIAQAREAFAEAVRWDPESAQAHYNLGDAYSKERRFADAAGEYQAALRLKPGFAAAEVNLGNAYFALGRLDEAETAYRDVTDSGAAGEHARLYLARLLKVREQMAQAKAGGRPSSD